MNKKDIMTGAQHCTGAEILLFADLGSKLCEVMNYSIDTNANDARRLTITFRTVLTVEDYERIGRMMIKSVMTEFGQKEESNIIPVECYFRRKRISLWERIRKLFKKKTIN